jgi:hypothetical protein
MTLGTQLALRMNRLLVNPGTSQAWEIQLRPGVNRIGRSEANDFTINHSSVSGSHCEITVSEAGILLRDLGSTNGTFVNRAPIREAWLQSGQHVQFGPVDMTFESDTVPAAAPAAVPPIPIPVPLPGNAPAPVGKLRINTPQHAEGAEPPPEIEAETAESLGEITPMDGGKAVCKSHPKTPARFLCNQCRKYFCELCVTSRGGGKYCRSCGQTLTPLRVHTPRPVAARGFFARLPGAFIYPFRGIGLLILVCATIAFLALEFISAGIFAIFAKMAVYGFVFLFMQNIIHTTTADENEPLSFPAADGLFGAFFELAGTILVSFGLSIGLLVAKAFFDVDIPFAAIAASVLLGCLYFPMAFLAVAMKDSVMAANPLVVIPAILRIPLEYLAASIVLMCVYGVRILGGMAAGLAGSVSLTTRDMSVMFLSMGGQAVWAFVSVYLLTVSMRILGLLYNCKKQEFGWFAH